MRRIVVSTVLLAASFLVPWSLNASGPSDAAALAKVAAVHGAAGPFAVIGYRMGERALSILGASYGSFDLDVIHRTPLEVQYSCVADGVQAATGVSVGKLNLHLEKSTVEHMETVVRNRKTGKEVVFRLKPEAISRFLNVPENRLEQAGREVIDLPASSLFSVATQ